jgi:ribosomal protein S18 acetylase RimI-like enzyme
MINLIDQIDPKTAKEILVVQQAAYLQESLLIDYPDLPPLKETLEDIQDSSETFLGYQLNDEIVGVLSYDIQDDVLTITRLVVHPDFSRRGIGKSLLEKVLHHPIVNHFIVGTAAKNIPALKLYEKYGFATTSRQTLPGGLELVRLGKHQR